MTEVVNVETPPEAPAEQPAPSDDDERILHTNLLLYRFLPVGSFTVTFDTTGNEKMAHISASCCGCCAGTEQSVPMNDDTTLQVLQQPLCHCGRLVRDAGLAFVLAFLFHLIPSIIWGAEESLGSSSNHQLMGAVWFGGWPIWFIIMQFLRPWGIQIQTKNNDDNATIFVPFASWKHATEVVACWEKSKYETPMPPMPEKPSLFHDLQFIVGWIFFLVLIINMFVTGALVTDCNSRGCCKDDEDTLDCCVETGYPEC
ncbi:expressed unknown protein [Seminavis robusta]|uniref:Uncharacterized protein n=1 Tax=Seminavis robusta TaxID=568900 RepID=A0A9N8EZ59_9STRA|nr:expressed unknown protein [Seminavis robusta]|eukprot:Sro2212_g319260.1 n/a (257) ;mRNA; r:8121-8891